MKPIIALVLLVSIFGLATCQFGRPACRNDFDCFLFEVCENGFCMAKEDCLPHCPWEIPTTRHPQEEPRPRTTETPLRPPCEDGWTLMGEHCYFVDNGTSTYSQALVWCVEHQAKVVWFDQSSEAAFRHELNAVNQLVLNNSVRTYWIGLNKKGEKWFWTNGEEMKFSNWRRSQPDRCCAAPVTCLLVNYHTPRGEWEDAGCERHWRQPQGFVCKKPRRP